MWGPEAAALSLPSLAPVFEDYSIGFACRHSAGISSSEVVPEKCGLFALIQRWSNPEKTGLMLARGSTGQTETISKRKTKHRQMPELQLPRYCWNKTSECRRQHLAVQFRKLYGIVEQSNLSEAWLKSRIGAFGARNESPEIKEHNSSGTIAVSR